MGGILFNAPLLEGFRMIERFLGLVCKVPQWGFGMGHDHAGGKGDGRIGDIARKVFAHFARQTQGRLPGADEKEIITAGKYGVSVAKAPHACCVPSVFAIPGQPQ